MQTNILNLKKDLENIQKRNGFLNRFGWGPISDVNIQIPNDGKYPVLWVIPQGVNLYYNAVAYKLRLLVFDIDDKSDKLRLQIQNDTLITLNDVINQFRNGSDDYELSEEAPLAIPFEQTFVDYCSGWYADITVLTDSMSTDGLCEFPERD